MFNHKLIKAASYLYVLSLLFGKPALAESQKGQEAFHNEVVELYSFQPHLISKSEIAMKSADLDVFWMKVKHDKDSYLPLLRTELQAVTQASFFGFDGALLFLELTQDPNDMKIALSALSKVDLRDVSGAGYVNVLNKLAGQGMDTSDAALRILDAPNFKAFFPVHSFDLNKTYALLFMLFPMNEDRYIDKLVQRLSVEKNVEAQKILLELLWYTVTEKGSLAIKRFSADESKPKESRAWVQELLDRQKDIPREVKRSSETMDQLRAARKNVLKHISDEATEEFDHLTARMFVHP